MKGKKNAEELKRPSILQRRERPTEYQDPNTRSGYGQKGETKKVSRREKAPGQTESLRGT